MDVAFEASKLIKFSPKRNAAFDQIRVEESDDASPGIGIRKFCPTRWTVRGDSISSILENYNALKQLWDKCLQSKNLDPSIKGRLIGAKLQMSKFNTLFGLHLCERILKITDNLSKTLQIKSMCASEAQDLTRMTVETLKGMRKDEMFKLFFQHVHKLCEQTGTEEPSLPRKRRAPARFEVGEGTCYFSSDIDEHYRRLYFEVLDLIVSGIQQRFNQPGYAIYQNLEDLLLNAANGKDYATDLKAVTDFYGDDFVKSELITQLQIFSSNFPQEQRSASLHEIIHYFQGLAASQRVYSCSPINKCSKRTQFLYYETGEVLFKEYHVSTKAIYIQIKSFE